MAKEIILPFSELKATLDDTPIEPTLEITENGVYNVKGYVYADVNVEGGGGSSDFSTAKVTATYILPEGVDSPEELVFATNSYFSIIKAEDNEYLEHSVDFFYGDKLLPLTLLGTVSQINVPLFSPDEYYTIFAVQYEEPNLGTLTFDITTSSVVSGDAEIDADYIKITGDCVLNLALVK